MFTKKQATGKLYELRGIVAGMIAAVDGEALTFDQALKTVTAYCVKASEENAAPGTDGE
jgi:hypothetical protein